MSLLGKPLLIVLAVVAILAPIGTLILWSKIRGPKAVRAVSRLALLGVCELTAVLLVSAAANDYGQFYSSWDDLIGTVHGNYKTSVYGASAPSASRAAAKDLGRPLPDLGTMRMGAVTSWSSPAHWKTEGKVVQVSITGKRSKLSNKGYVYLPPEYFQARYAHTMFPAVEALTGYPGMASNLVFRMNYPKFMLSLVRQHRAAPTIYVMLSSTVAAPRDTECTDVPGGPQAETYLAAELPSAVEHALRVQPGAWGVIGDSTGGYCAAKIAMYHPNTFVGGASMSGYYHALSDWTTGDLWGGSAARHHRNDLEWALAHHPAPPANLYLSISKQEGGANGYQDTMRFLHLVKPPMRVTVDITPVGGHNFRSWARVMPRAMAWLSKQQTQQIELIRSATKRDCHHCSEMALPDTTPTGSRS